MNNYELIEISEKISEKMIKAILEANDKISYENKKLPLSTNDGIWMINIKDIIRMEGDGSYTKIYLLNGKCIHIAKTIKAYEALLYDYKFERIHKSHLINLLHVKKYYKNEGSYVLMEDGKEIGVAKIKREKLMVRLQLL